MRAIIGCLVLSSLGGGCASTRPAADSQRGPLVGAWRSHVQFTDGDFAPIKDLEFLYVFNVGGTMTESSNYDSAPPVPPAYGVWREVGPGRFEAVYVFYVARPPEKPEQLAGGWGPAGRGELLERIDLSPDGHSFNSTLMLKVFDQAGIQAPGIAHATARGTRIGF